MPEGDTRGVGVVLALVLKQLEIQARRVGTSKVPSLPANNAKKGHRLLIRGVLEGNVALPRRIELERAAGCHLCGALSGHVIAGGHDLDRAVGVGLVVVIHRRQVLESLAPGVAQLAFAGIRVAQGQLHQVVVDRLAVDVKGAVDANVVLGYPLPVAIAGLALQEIRHRGRTQPLGAAVVPLAGNKQRACRLSAVGNACGGPVIRRHRGLAGRIGARRLSVITVLVDAGRDDFGLEAGRRRGVIGELRLPHAIDDAQRGKKLVV